jgi:hypothetical protein
MHEQLESNSECGGAVQFAFNSRSSTRHGNNVLYRSLNPLDELRRRTFVLGRVQWRSNDPKK